MNVAVVMAYAFAVTMVLCCGVWLLERALTNLRLPIRWAWLGALALSVWLPLASLVSSPGQGTAADTTAVSGVAVPIGQIELMGGEANAGSMQVSWAASGLLAEWRRSVDRVVAAGASRLPTARVAPSWIAGIWGTASILIATVLFGSVLRLNRRMRRWPDELLLGRRVKVSPDLGPATVGVRNPLIVVPRWARELPHDELDLVLRHEGEHVRSRDTLLLALGLAAVVACPWNPLVWWQVRRLKAAVEVDCDRRVLRDGVAPARYGDLLVRLGSRGRLASLGVPTIAGSTSLLERRLTVMKSLRSRTSVPAALAATGVALLLVIVACTSEPPVANDTNAAPDASAAASPTATSEPTSQDVVAIRVERDGTVRVNGEIQPVDRVSEAVAPLNSERVVVAIEAHQAVPYQVIATVQDQIRAAGLLRVVFIAFESDELRRSAPRTASTVADEGLPVVLPDTTLLEIGQRSPGFEVAPMSTVNPRNLMFLEVMPTGAVLVQRGESRAVQMVTHRQVEGLLRMGLGQNPNLIAVVRTHPDAEYRHMYRVLDALQRAQATRFALQLAE
jgi:beta-lactamase regulating signal transducer with metallopeptidase domain